MGTGGLGSGWLPECLKCQTAGLLIVQRFQLWVGNQALRSELLACVSYCLLDRCIKARLLATRGRAPRLQSMPRSITTSGGSSVCTVSHTMPRLMSK